MSYQCWHCFELFNQNELRECQDCGFDYCVNCIQDHDEKEEEEVISKCDYCGKLLHTNEPGNERFCNTCTLEKFYKLINSTPTNLLIAIAEIFSQV